VGIIARVPLAFGALSGRFTSATRFTGDDHRKRLYVGKGLDLTLRKVKRLGFLAAGYPSLAEAALRWTLAFPEVSVTIPGIRNPRQAILNCRVGDLPPLTPTAVEKARKLYRSNFGLPISRVATTEGVPAVLMSGVKAVPVRPQARKSPKGPQGPTRKRKIATPSSKKRRKK
jgi:hypothetical protein